MPTYNEAARFAAQAKEMKRQNAERLRKLKYNPDGTLRIPGPEPVNKNN